MTRKAESLTIQLHGEDGIWTPSESVFGDTRGNLVAKAETRPVMPDEFMIWYSKSWPTTEAGWISRLLHISRTPHRISTSIRVVVRLEVRDQRLYRKWVAFSGMERSALAKWELPYAELDPTPFLLGSARLVFTASDLPLATLPLARIWRCDEHHPLHSYRCKMSSEPRVVNLASSPLERQTRGA